MRKKSKPKPKKLHPRSAGNADIEMGRLIRARRVESGMSQSALAEQLGITFQQVQKYEKGVNRVGAARLQGIAAALGVDLTFFYGGNGKELEVESLLFLDNNISLRLLHAYTAIKDQAVRRQFVTLIEMVAASQG
jgi:transcriptional regulator with XRE-family HTH domain